jgi:hypothetical protein
MLQGDFEDDDFLQVSSARNLVNISGMVRGREEVKMSKQLILGKISYLNY